MMSPDSGAENLRLGELFAALQSCVLERRSASDYKLVAGAPVWFRRFGIEVAQDGLVQPGRWFPFLESFLQEAEDSWASNDPSPLQSGPWVEIAPDDGEEAHLEATALLVGGRPVLLLRELGDSYLERRDLLQKARENSLNYQRLLREVQMKEVLLHCIVHDLAGPLTGVKGLFALLAGEPLSEAGRRRLKIGEDAASRLEGLIHDILDVFSADVDALQSFSVDPLTAPDLLKCARTVVDTLQPAAAWRNIALELKPDGEDEVFPVAGETTRLERVLFNLIENALRHSPPRGAVTISVRRHEDEVRCEVSDEGSGVPAEEASQLFKKFRRGARRSGKAGLGLYFCRIMVERWGGRIDYRTRNRGGACFSFSLPLIGGGGPRSGESTG